MIDPLTLNPKVMVVSNQQTTGPLWVFSLQQQQHVDVILESIPANTIVRWKIETPDIVIFDISFPESQTIELVEKLREETIVPVILLTASRSEEFLLTAYNAGIDDHLFKPVSPSLFNAKIKVWLRHLTNIPASALDPIKVGDLALIPSERKIKVRDNDPVRLSNLEFRLLFVLMNHSGQTITVGELNERVWGYSSETDNTMLKNVIYRLRRKIEQDPANPQVIQTVVGVGYKFINQ
jgi:DNA-binding response OmpR family regulator